MKTSYGIKTKKNCVSTRSVGYDRDCRVWPFSTRLRMAFSTRPRMQKQMVKRASVQACKRASVQACKRASVQACKRASVHLVLGEQFQYALYLLVYKVKHVLAILCYFLNLKNSLSNSSHFRAIFTSLLSL